jgi:hypothetical protein
VCGCGESGSGPPPQPETRPAPPASDPPPAAGTDATEAAGPRALFAAFRESVNAKDARALLALYVQDGPQRLGANVRNMITAQVKALEGAPPFAGKPQRLAQARRNMARTIAELGLSDARFPQVPDAELAARFYERVLAGGTGLFAVWRQTLTQRAGGALTGVIDVDATHKTLEVRSPGPGGITQTDELPIVLEGGRWRFAPEQSPEAEDPDG